MAERSDQPQDPSTQDERPEVYSISQDQDGSFRLTRRSFLTLGAAAGGMLLVRGVCPRFGARPAPGASGQAGWAPLSRVYVHAAPSIASDIADTLQASDFVRLIDDRPDLGWVRVATQSGKQGWVERSSLDFTRATNSPPDVGPSGTPTPAATPTDSPQTLSIQLCSQDSGRDSAVGPAQASGELIANGDFEAGSGFPWTEVSTGGIVRSDHPNPYQGSWVAWFGGISAVERLTQFISVPLDVRNAQILTFYIEVTTEEGGSTVDDRFDLRFLDGIGTPITSLAIANNTTPTNWQLVEIEITGMANYAGQGIQMQFVCTVDAIDSSSFAIDLVSMTPAPYRVYLPVVIKDPPSTSTPTPVPTSTPCSSHCSFDCSSDCSSDCYSDCYSDCTFDCIYDCTFDCIYDCSYDWYSANKDDTQ